MSRVMVRDSSSLKTRIDDIRDRMVAELGAERKVVPLRDSQNGSKAMAADGVIYERAADEIRDALLGARAGRKAVSLEIHINDPYVRYGTFVAGDSYLEAGLKYGFSKDTSMRRSEVIRKALVMFNDLGFVPRTPEELYLCERIFTMARQLQIDIRR